MSFPTGQAWRHGDVFFGVHGFFAAPVPGEEDLGRTPGKGDYRLYILNAYTMAHLTAPYIAQ